MFVAHFFQHPQIQQGEKAGGGKRTVSTAFCTKGVDGIQDLQGQDGVEIRAAEGTTYTVQK